MPPQKNFFDKCFCPLLLLTFVLLVAGLLFTIVNFVHLINVKNELLNPEGIPGTKKQQDQIRTLLQKIGVKLEGTTVYVNVPDYYYYEDYYPFFYGKKQRQRGAAHRLEKQKSSQNRKQNLKEILGLLQDNFGNGEADHQNPLWKLADDRLTAANAVASDLNPSCTEGKSPDCFMKSSEKLLQLTKNSLDLQKRLLLANMMTNNSKDLKTLEMQKMLDPYPDYGEKGIKAYLIQPYKGKLDFKVMVLNRELNNYDDAVKKCKRLGGRFVSYLAASSPHPFNDAAEKFMDMVKTAAGKSSTSDVWGFDAYSSIRKKWIGKIKCAQDANQVKGKEAKEAKIDTGVKCSNIESIKKDWTTAGDYATYVWWNGNTVATSITKKAKKKGFFCAIDSVLAKLQFTVDDLKIGRGGIVVGQGLD